MRNIKQKSRISIERYCSDERVELELIIGALKNSVEELLSLYEKGDINEEEFDRMLNNFVKIYEKSMNKASRAYLQKIIDAAYKEKRILKLIKARTYTL